MILRNYSGGLTGHGFLREPNDIRSYAALACSHPIQSERSARGQSIPNFDYGMAPGIAKTYARLYRQNLAKALELMTDLKDAFKTVEQISEEIQEKYNLMPSFPDAMNIKHMKGNCCLCLINDKGTLSRVQKFAEKSAWRETDQAAYQAMEALYIILIPCTAGQEPKFSVP